MGSSFHLIVSFICIFQKVYFVKSILPSSDLTSINLLVMFWRCLSSTLPGGLSHCVFPCPLPRALIVLVKVCLVQPEIWHLNIWGKSLEYSSRGTTARQSQLLLKQNYQHPIITWQFQEQGGHLGLGHRGGNRWRAAPGRKMFQIWTGLCYRARESCNQGFHANLWHGERRWPLGP